MENGNYSQPLKLKKKKKKAQLSSGFFCLFICLFFFFFFVFCVFLKKSWKSVVLIKPPIFKAVVLQRSSFVVEARSVCRKTSRKPDPSMRLYPHVLHLRLCFTHIKVLLESVGPWKFRGKEFIRSKARLRQSHSQRPGFLRRKQSPHSSVMLLRGY